MKYYLLFFLLLHWGGLLFSQEVQVVDGTSKEGIPFTTIYNIDKSKISTANEKGYFNLNTFKPDDALVFKSLGFDTLTMTVLEVKKEGKVTLGRKAFNLDAVQVSALRWRFNPNDIPNRIYAIDQKDLFIQQPQTAADLLSVSNKVFIQKSQMGGGSPMIRGFSSNRLLYSVDGVRMNTAIFRSGNVHNVISLDPFAIEESEVMLGPGSVMYGSDALGGVLRFETLKPVFRKDSANTFSGNVSSRFGSANTEKTLHIDLNAAFEKWAFLSSITFTDYNHLIMGKNGPADFLQDTFAIRLENEDILATPRNNRMQMKTAYSQQNFMQKIAHKIDSNHLIEYAFHYSETSDIPRYDRLTQKRNGRLRFAEWDYGPQKWMMHQLGWNSDKKRKLANQIKINLAFQRFEESRKNRRLNSNILNITEEQVDALSGNIDFIKSVSSKHKLSYGIETVFNLVESKGSIKNINNLLLEEAASRYPNSFWNSNAFYLNDIFSVSNNTTLNVGMRVNHFNLHSDFDTTLFPYPETKTRLNFLALTGSFGLNHQLNEKTLLSFLVSNGFRAPNVDDIGKVFDSEPGAVVVPNSALNSEKVYNIELGLKQSFQAKLLIDFSAYYTILEDAMVRRNDLYQGKDSIDYQGEMSQVQSIQNAASAYIYGFNIGMQYSINKNLRIRSNYNYQNGEEEIEGIKSSIRHVSPSFGNVELSYSNSDFTLVLNYQFSDGFTHEELNLGERNKAHLYAMDQNGRPFSPSWYVVNIGLTYQAQKSVSYFIGVDNVSNQRYRTYSSGIAAAGRNFIASLNYKF